MRYALIGCGRISPNHIAAALSNNLEIIGLCDLDIEKAKKAAAQFGLNERTILYTDYRELIHDKHPELVAIATESGKHAQIALYCIEQGCNVIIEKPIALSLKDADKIIKASQHNNVKVSTCHQNRFNKSIQKIKESIDNKRFGKMLYGTAHIRWNRGKDYYIQGPWRGTWVQDGGALMNQCIHNIDLLRWLMGSEILEVSGFTDRLNHDFIQAEDFGMAMIKFRNGSYGLVEGTTNIYPQNLEETLYLFGERGTVKAGGKSVNRIDEWFFQDNLDKPEDVKYLTHENPPSVYGFGHTPLYQDVISSIRENRPPYVDANAGKEALELVLAIYKSSKEKRIVTFPLESCSTLDFINLFERG